MGTPSSTLRRTSSASRSALLASCAQSALSLAGTHGKHHCGSLSRIFLTCSFHSPSSSIISLSVSDTKSTPSSPFTRIVPTRWPRPQETRKAATSSMVHDLGRLELRLDAAGALDVSSSEDAQGVAETCGAGCRATQQEAREAASTGRILLRGMQRSCELQSFEHH